MMRARSFRAMLFVACGAFLTTASVYAQGGTLSIRLLEADSSERPSSDSLDDVLPMLKRTLRFSSYRLLRMDRIDRRNGASATLGQGLTVVLSRVEAQSMTVEVSKHGRRVVETRVVLVSGKPVIIGGIPGEKATMLILVFSDQRADARPSPSTGSTPPRRGGASKRPGGRRGAW